MQKDNSMQQTIFQLQEYWASVGCVILPAYDMEVGAGTFHPATVLRALGTKPWYAAFVQPSRRPTDGRYGENPNRLFRHHQFQVLLKPAPSDIQELYLKSLEAVGISSKEHDIRFVEDDWESPTLGASGLGWEVWCDGMEVTQFTYFQQMGGVACNPITVELTYGLERLCMFIQNVENVYDLAWNSKNDKYPLTYGDIYQLMEKQWSYYNFEYANIEDLLKKFDMAEKSHSELMKHKMVIPAYERCLEASHLFNTLEARGAISVSERARFIGRVRDMAKSCSEMYVEMFD